MSFVSFQFLAFLALVFILYFTLPRGARWVVLLAASAAFYIFSGWRYIFYIAATILTTWGAGLLIGRRASRASEQAREYGAGWSADERDAFRRAVKNDKRLIAAAALALNLGALAVLKYAGLFAPVAELGLVLPLGVSFYTFQSAGYVIDVCRGRYAPDKSLAKYALFVSFFPQLVQGPIGRHDKLAEQLVTPHDFDLERAHRALLLMLWGYFKKCVIADRVAILVVRVFDEGGVYSGCVGFFAAALYGLQIYCDFSGGIDVARGVARFLGIELAENFKRPYFAESLSDFWRRWHITLGDWMKDYVFYPLAISNAASGLGSRLEKRLSPRAAATLPICIAQLFTFLLVGLWHGATLNFAIYGLWNGFFIALSTLIEPLLSKMYKYTKISRDAAALRALRAARTFALVSLGRFFVRAAGTGQALFMFAQTFSGFRARELFDGTLLSLGLDGANLAFVAAGIGVLACVGSLREMGVDICASIVKMPLPLRWTLEFIAIFAVVILGLYGEGYDAASFIYMGY